MLYRVSLALKSCREFPAGNSQCRYEMCIPLTHDFRLDSDAWQHERHRTRVCRMWRDQAAQIGRLTHDAAGWNVIFGHGDRAEDAILEGEHHLFLKGKSVSILEPDGQARIYSVVAVEPDAPT